MKKQFLCALLALSILITPVFADTNSTLSQIPEDLSHTTQAEWDVLMNANIERAKEGLFLLVTTDLMQEMAEVRSSELIELFSHTRPDGSSCFTVFTDFGFKCNSSAENIALGYYSANSVSSAWMNSPGHKANILNSSLRMLGVGRTGASWAQLFSSDPLFICKSITYNEGFGYFTLILSDGTVAYAPYNAQSSPTVNGEVTFHYPTASDFSGKIEVENEILHPFTDVQSGIFYEDAVVWASDNNITTGLDDTTFGPDGTCTRAQVVTFLWRANGEPIAKNRENFFTDVSESDYFYEAVLWAVENEITTGTSDTNFSPYDDCFSVQVLTFLWRANNKPDQTDAQDYYTDAVNWANSNGFFEDMSSEIEPSQLGLRYEIVTYLYRNAN